MFVPPGLFMAMEISSSVQEDMFPLCLFFRYCLNAFIRKELCFFGERYSDFEVFYCVHHWLSCLYSSSFSFLRRFISSSLCPCHMDLWKAKAITRRRKGLTLVPVVTYHTNSPAATRAKKVDTGEDRRYRSVFIVVYYILPMLSLWL